MREEHKKGVKNFLSTLAFLLLAITLIANGITLNTFADGNNYYEVNFSTPGTETAYITLYKYINVTNATMNYTGNNSYLNSIPNGDFETGLLTPWTSSITNISGTEDGQIEFNNITNYEPIQGFYSLLHNLTLPGATLVHESLFSNTVNFTKSNDYITLTNLYGYSGIIGIDQINQTIYLNYQNGTNIATLYSNTVTPTVTGGINYTLNFNLSESTSYTDLQLRIDDSIYSGVTIGYTNVYSKWDYIYQGSFPSNTNSTINESSDYLWNQTGVLNYTDTVNETIFANDLQTYLDNCETGTCSVPVNVYSASLGAVNLTSLEINYASTAGIYTRARDIDTTGLVNATIEITNDTDYFSYAMTFDGTNDTYFFPYAVLPTGEVTLTYSATGYENAIYYQTLGPEYQPNVTAYLLNSSKPDNIYTRFYVQNTMGVLLPNVLLTFYQPINGTYVLVRQLQTDDTGQTAGIFDSSVTYKITANATGYTTVTTFRRLLTADTYIILGTAINNVVEIPGAGIYYSLYPDAIAEEMQTFYFNVSTNGSALIDYVNLTIINASNLLILNSTINATAPYGDNLTITYNTSTLTGNTALIGSIKVTWYDTQLNYYRMYYISSIQITLNQSNNNAVDKLIQLRRANEDSAGALPFAIFALLILVSLLFFFNNRKIGENQLLILATIVIALLCHLELLHWNFFFLSLLLTSAVIISRSEFK